MIKDGHIGEHEAVVAGIMFMGAKIFLSFPQHVATVALTAGWLAVLFGSAFCILGFVPQILLVKKYPNCTIVEAGEMAGGKVLGVLAVVVYSTFFAAITGLTVRELSENVVTAVLTETPPSVVMGLFILVGMYMAYMGLEVVVRTTFLIFPWLMAGFLLVHLLDIPYVELVNLLPLWGRGFLKTVSSGVTLSSLYAESFLFPLIYPAFRRKRLFVRTSMLSIALTAAVLTFIVMLFSTVFPIPSAEIISFPLYQLARLIYRGRFVQRLEAVFVFVWVIGGVLNLAIGLYVSVICIARGLKLPVFRPLIFPVAVIIYCIAFTPPDYVTTVNWHFRLLRTYGFIPIFGLPALLYVIGLFRGRKDGAPNTDGSRTAKK